MYACTPYVRTHARMAVSESTVSRPMSGLLQLLSLSVRPSILSIYLPSAACRVPVESLLPPNQPSALLSPSSASFHRRTYRQLTILQFTLFYSPYLAGVLVLVFLLPLLFLLFLLFLLLLLVDFRACSRGSLVGSGARPAGPHLERSMQAISNQQSVIRRTSLSEPYVLRLLSISSPILPRPLLAHGPPPPTPRLDPCRQPHPRSIPIRPAIQPSSHPALAPLRFLLSSAISASAYIPPYSLFLFLFLFTAPIPIPIHGHPPHPPPFEFPPL